MSHYILPSRLANASRGVRHVFVRDLDLEARVGVHRNEKGRSQPVRINIDLEVSEDATPAEDRLDAVVCYEQVVKSVKAILASGHVNLVETLAERIAQKCLEDPRVRAARVRVEKPEAIPEARGVGVEIERIQPSSE
jgi:dihydroneopterin aldolase